MNNWKLEKLLKLCIRIGDGLHGTPEYSDDSDIFFINGNNLKAGRIEITENTKRISEDELERNFIRLNENTLLLSINGTLGSLAFYNNEKVMLGKSAAYLNFKSKINRFYYYYFQLDSVQQYFHNVATGSTIKNLSLKSIQDYEVPVPEKHEWENISNVLASLDSKIALNNRINVELEAMAKTVYDYWFVQFDFPFDFAQGQPSAEGKPYKSSGGKMVWCEELKREIPEGWKVAELKDAAEIKYGKDHKKIDLGNVPIYGSGGIMRYGNQAIYEKHSILIPRKGSLGNLFYVSRPFWTVDTMFYTKMKVENVGRFLFYYLQSQNISSLNVGTAVPSLTTEVLNQIKILIPTKDVLADFETITIPIFEMVEKNVIENQQLSSLRDWLLPMLMNGQVKVGENV